MDYVIRANDYRFWGDDFVIVRVLNTIFITADAIINGIKPNAINATLH